MADVVLFQPSTRPRALLTGIGLIGLVAAGVALDARHTHVDAGLSADALPSPSMAVVSHPAATGALLLDLVEPDAGEGGSDAELAALVAEVSALGVPVAPAGFYSEGEHLFRVEGSAAELARVHAALAGHALVEGIEPEVMYGLIESPADARALEAVSDAVSPTRRQRFEPDDEMFGLQWHMEMIHAPEAWAVHRGRGVVVAVIDTGVAYKDGPGGAKRVPDLAGTAFTEGKTFSSGLPDGLDDHLHGTHVAGTIAQTTNNQIGVTGVAHEATIMPLKVLSSDGRGSVADIANAIRYAADHGAQVINMSLGGPLPSRVMSKAIEYANDKGVTVVCAAGNESKSRVGYPAASKGAVAVAAVDAMGERTWYSNWGKHLDISAPGGDTRADRNGDGHPDGVLQNTIRLQDPTADDYMWLQGTSMASPHAAGVAALVVARGVTNPDEVERILKQTAVHPNGLEWDREYGAGVIDAAAAVDAAQSDYAPERAALGGLLALLGFAGFAGFAGGTAAGVAARRRGRLGDVLGLTLGAGLAAGAFGVTPMAYGLAETLGIAAHGSPLWLSALLPFALIATLLGVRRLRGLLAGVALGYAALLLHGAIVLPTLVSGLPGDAWVDRVWLAGNALFALWLARRVFRTMVR